MCECGRGLIEVCGDALLCVLEVLDGVEFAGEEVRDIENMERAALWDEAKECQFVESVLKMFLFHHGLQLLVECGGIGLAHALDAETLAGSKGWVACLTDFGDGSLTVHHDLHLLLAKLMPDKGEDIIMLRGKTRFTI